LNALDDQEIEAVLGHELTHIKNGDVQMMVIAVIIAGVVGFFAELLFRGFSNFGYYGGGWGGGGGSSWSSSSSSSDSGGGGSDSGDKKGSGGAAILIVVVAIVLIVLAWALSQLVKLALSRSRELLADAGSVELTKNPDAMISALRKIEAQAAMQQIPSRMQAFFIESPALLPESGIFATHPSVNERVAALIEFAGGRDLPLGSPEQLGSSGFLPPDVQSSLAPRERGPWG